MAVLVYTHIAGSCSKATEVRTLSRMDDKPIRRCSVHPNRSQMPTAMAMTITADSLLREAKIRLRWGYDVAVKGLSIVVTQEQPIKNVQRYECNNHCF